MGAMPAENWGDNHLENPSLKKKDGGNIIDINQYRPFKDGAFNSKEETKDNILNIEATPEKIRQIDDQIRMDISEPIDASKMFAPKDKEEWMKGCENIKQMFVSGQITLEQLKEQISELKQYLGKCMETGGKDTSPIKTRTKLKEMLDKEDSNNVYIRELKDLVIKESEFENMVYAEKEKFFASTAIIRLLQIKQKFEKEKPIFYKAGKVNEKFESAKTIVDKVKILVDSAKEVERREDIMEDKKKDIQQMIEKKKYTASRDQLLKFKKELKEKYDVEGLETYKHFEFHLLEEKVQLKIKERKGYLEEYRKALKDDNLEIAIAVLQRAQEIEHKPKAQKEIYRLQGELFKKNSALRLYDEGEKLIQDGKKDQGIAMKNRSYEMYPKLKELKKKESGVPEEVKKKQDDEKASKAKTEKAVKILAQNEKLGILLDKEKVLGKIVDKKKLHGQRMSDRASITDKIKEKTIEDDTKKEILKNAGKNVIELKNYREQKKEDNIIKINITDTEAGSTERENAKYLHRELTENKIDFDSFIIQKNKYSKEPLRVNQILDVTTGNISNQIEVLLKEKSITTSEQERKIIHDRLINTLPLAA